ncbi:MAG: ubiquinol-cytochrome c reductase iron-sulfur subunit [Bacteroidetes bacterium]|nr:ubiquinol-cytochrome c reductase iron-sulfur subunit [Bacteroidota bacterium]
MASTRRQFLNRILAGGITAITVYVIYPILRFFDPPSVTPDEQSRIFVATAEEMNLNSAKFFRLLDRAAVLVRLPNGNYRSLSAKCTDLGCTVSFRPVGDYFHCNCHGSEFSISGRVLRGPAERPLEEYDVSVEGDKIYVSAPAKTV